MAKNPPANAWDGVRALVWEDPTCRGATKPVCHNYWACVLEPASHDYEPACHNHWACALELVSHNYWSLWATTTEAHEPQLLKPVRLEPLLRNKILQWEARAPQWRVVPPGKPHHILFDIKINIIFYFFSNLDSSNLSPQLNQWVILGISLLCMTLLFFIFNLKFFMMIFTV